MAIKLEVRPYCSTCLDFEPDVTKPERSTLMMSVSLYSRDVPAYDALTDTIVKCKYANRCANLVRHLTKQIMEDN